jgi:hypothetical protein
VILGLVAGWGAVSYWDEHGGLNHWLWTTLFVSATSTIGGMIGRAALPIPAPTKRARKPKVR